jgi:signal transduction histidine kinase/CheY-like chemotaxis protein
MRLMRADGSTFWAHMQATPQHNGEYWIVFNDISERRKIDEVQSYLLQISSLPSNDDFFESLASYLAKTLNMDYVCIDRLQGDCLSARTLAVYHDGRFEDNVEYTLKDTPCGDVVGKEVCVFPRGVCSLFPQDPALQDLKAESYVGTTLWSFDMKPIGLIAVIGRKELLNSHFAESVLKLVSIRAAAELERRQAEEERSIIQQQFQQAQKLESLGVLAGGIAHDFNNLLTVIMSSSSLAQLRPNMVGELLPEIDRAAERAADLCRQMLAYAGKTMMTMKQVRMAELVEDMIRLLNATISQNVTITSDLALELPPVKGDAGQLRQIVMNLIINAAEAIGEGHGEIRVVLSVATVAGGKVEKDHLGKIIAAGQYVCLEVTDSGCGMDDETRQRVFEPFYTTKFTGRGLGMSAVLGIIAAHKGALQLISSPGEGTTFKVYLPVQGSDIKGGTPLPYVPLTPWKGNGTLLLVEDEPQISMVAKVLIQTLGFSVIEAANGREALERYQENAGSITLVVTDIGMPVMDGYDLFNKLKVLAPDLPIIISSGFGETIVSSRIAVGAAAGYLNKPYSLDQLREVLKVVVEKRR